MKSAYNFVPGVMGLILMIICAMMTSVAIVREKEMGTMEILLVSPVRPIFVILSKAVPYLVLSLVNLATILLLSRFVLDVPVAGSIIIHLGLAGFGIIHLLPGTNTGGGIANLGYGADDSDYFAFRNDIQHRKYAGNPTGIV